MRRKVETIPLDPSMTTHGTYPAAALCMCNPSTSRAKWIDDCETLNSHTEPWWVELELRTVLCGCFVIVSFYLRVCADGRLRRLSFDISCRRSKDNWPLFLFRSCGNFEFYETAVWVSFVVGVRVGVLRKFVMRNNSELRRVSLSDGSWISRISIGFLKLFNNKTDVVIKFVRYE